MAAAKVNAGVLKNLRFDLSKGVRRFSPTPPNEWEKVWKRIHVGAGYNYTY